MTTKPTHKDATARRLVDEIERLNAAFQCYVEEQQKDRAEIESLRAELEAKRNSQISAVNGMLAAEQREAATIERCAQVAENFDLSLEYRVRDTIKAIAAAIRALKDIKEKSLLSQPQSK